MASGRLTGTLAGSEWTQRNQLLSLFAELNRRNVLRVAAAYAVAAWLLIQIADTTLPLFGFGDTPARIAVIVLIIGFIPTLIIAWVFELTPDGLRKNQDADRSRASVAISAARFDQIIMLVLVLAVSYLPSTSLCSGNRGSDPSPQVRAIKAYKDRVNLDSCWSCDWMIEELRYGTWARRDFTTYKTQGLCEQRLWYAQSDEPDARYRCVY